MKEAKDVVAEVLKPKEFNRPISFYENARYYFETVPVLRRNCITPLDIDKGVTKLEWYFPYIFHFMLSLSSLSPFLISFSFCLEAFTTWQKKKSL